MKRLLVLLFLSTAMLAKDKSQISLDALAVTVPDRSYAYVVLPKGQYMMLRCNSFDRNCSRGLMPGTYTADTDGKWFWIHNELRPIKYHGENKECSPLQFPKRRSLPFRLFGGRRRALIRFCYFPCDAVVIAANLRH